MLQRYRKIRRTSAQLIKGGEALNWLTTWTTYTIYGRVIMRYTKLQTIVQYKVVFGKSKPSEKNTLR
jgi:hypothetical protein